MAPVKTTQTEAIEVFTLLDGMDIKQRELAGALGIAENKISKVRSGDRQLTAAEHRKAMEWLLIAQSRGGFVERAEHHPVESLGDYLPVEILPSFAGMGGGGSGEGEVEHALISRRLIEDELRAQPSDLLLIETRGESMSPDFSNGPSAYCVTHSANQCGVVRHRCSP